ncbi:MAG: hypothetical protein FJX53_11455 [Alphaproteobacteria bacterium]|nr:hypothetical protein [Alphaproteobacteria bacterium]
MGLAPNRELAFAAIRQHEMEPLGVHRAAAVRRVLANEDTPPAGARPSRRRAGQGSGVPVPELAVRPPAARGRSA